MDLYMQLDSGDRNKVTRIGTSEEGTNPGDPNPWFSLTFEMKNLMGQGGLTTADSSGDSPDAADRLPTFESMIRDDPQGFADAIAGFVLSKVPADSLPVEFGLSAAFVTEQVSLLPPPPAPNLPFNPSSPTG